MRAKTGWTSQALGCLIVIYQAPDRSGYIINVVLGSENRFEDMKALMSWLEDAYEWN